MITPNSFKDGMRRLAGAVSVIATGGASGIDGKTITSCCSVTLEPPTLLVCLYEQTNFYSKLLKNGVFSINILSEQDQGVAHYFAKSQNGDVQEVLSSRPWKLHNGLPVCSTALTSFICTVEDILIKGTHAVVFGTVHDVRLSDSNNPLLYFYCDYATLFNKHASAVQVP